MDSTTIKQLMSNYNYLIIIRCKINEEYANTKYIPSFITNKTVGYLVKNLNDINDIIKEIFLVWRYKYHSSSDSSIREFNIQYMEQTIQKLSNLNSVSYIDFKIDSGIKPFSDIDCCFRVYNMRQEFIHLLDLVYGKNRPEFNNSPSVVHRIIPYVIYSDPNPNRLQIHITHPDSITKNINQTCLFAKNIHDLNYYTTLFNKLGLEIKNQTKFIKMLNSGSSFLLTKDDFESESEYSILHSNVYFLSPVDTRETSVELDVYYLKMNQLIKPIDIMSMPTFMPMFMPTFIDEKIGSIIMSFL